MVNEDLYTRWLKRFEEQLQDVQEKSHQVLVSTFTVSPGEAPLLEEMVLVKMTENWVWFENAFEYQLLLTLIEKGRSFIKGSRCNLPAPSLC